jgi:hypothetical protein
MFGKHCEMGCRFECAFDEDLIMTFEQSFSLLGVTVIRLGRPRAGPSCCMAHSLCLPHPRNCVTLGRTDHNGRSSP